MDRGRADRLVQGQGGRLQGADVGRVPRRAGPHRHRQAAEVQAAGAVLGGPRPAGQLIRQARPGRRGRSSNGTTAACLREDVVDLLHGWYPPARPTLGRRRAWCRATPRRRWTRCCSRSTRTPRWRDEAAAWGADLLVVHHPLFLKPVHGVAATTPKGRTLHTPLGRVRAADGPHQRRPGGRRGSEALATASACDRPRSCPRPGPRPVDKLTVYVPAATPTGCGRRSPRPAPGDRRLRPRRRSPAPGEGRFRPLDGASPTDRRGRPPGGGRRGAGRGGAAAARRVRRSSRRCWPPTPYEEPAYDRRRARRPRRRRTDRHRPDRRRRADHAGRLRPNVVGGCRRRRRGAGRRVTRARRYAGSRCAAVPATSCSTRCGDRRGRLRHQRPAPPPGERVPGAGRPGAGRRGALGGRVDLAAGGGGAALVEASGRYGGDPGQHPVHRPVDPFRDLPPTEEPTLKADPAAQLKPARPPGARRPGRPAAPPARHPARVAEIAALRGDPAPSSTTRRPRRSGSWSTT